MKSDRSRLSIDHRAVEHDELLTIEKANGLILNVINKIIVLQQLHF